MRLGSITIRWTKDIKAEQEVRAKVNKIGAKVLQLQMDKNLMYEATLHRWGLDQGLIDRGASQKAKTPKGAGASI